MSKRNKLKNIFTVIFLLLVLTRISLALFSKTHYLEISPSAELKNDYSQNLSKQGESGYLEKENNIDESASKNKNGELREDKKEEIIAEKDILLGVPFTSQAPFGNWSDPRKQDGCEEAAAIMAMAWIRGDSLTPKKVDENINEISAYEEKTYGNFRDTSAFDSVERIYKGYFGCENAKAVENITAVDIKKELFKDNLVIVPVNGRKLGNPNYTPPGPSTHNLVIIGYDVLKKEFITNDSGTRKGKGYRYKEEVLKNALFDYPTGNHEKASKIGAAMIVVRSLENN